MSQSMTSQNQQLSTPQLQHQQRQTVTTTTTPSSISTMSSTSTTPSTRFSYMSIRSTTGTPCHLCSQNVQFNSTISSDQFVYHRECFKCAKCDKYITEQDSTYTLNETTRLVYCGFCSIRRKSMTPSSNIQSMIASINNNSAVHHHHAVANITTPTASSSNNTNNTTPIIPSSLLINRTSIPSTTSNHNGATSSHVSAIISANNLNDLKSKFEPVTISQQVAATVVNASSPSHTQSPTLSSSNVQLRSNKHHNDSPTLLSASTTTLVSSGGNSRSSHVITPRESKNYSVSASMSVRNDLNVNPSSETIAATPLPLTSDNVVKFRRSAAGGLSVGDSRSSNRLSNRLSSPEANLENVSPKAHRSRDSMPENKQTRSSIQLVVSSDCDWVNLKTHSAKCNIMLRKKRRGNKRSKSLPSKFDIDSLLDYFNYSMILNRYELKKLHQLHNAYFNMSNHHGRHTKFNTSLASNPNNSHLLMNNQAPLRPTSNVNSRCLTHHHHHPHHQFSSGYNSENHSNSSNSTGTIYTYQNNNTSSHTNNSVLNFYRMSLNHLPLNFTNTQCTCGGGGGRGVDDPHANKSNSLNHAKNGSSSLLSKSFSNQNISFRRQKCVASSPKVDNDDEDEEDVDDEDEDEDNYLDEDEDNIDEDLDDEEEVDEQDKLDETKANDKQDEIVTDSVATANDIKFNFNNGGLQRAPGTSNCPHTARIDIRRVRSLHDLTEHQLIFAETDFVFQEKLGEGFFANVKKIVSKQSKQEMVLKELKLNCVSFANGDCGTNGETVSSSCSSLAATDLPQLPPPPRMDLISNYAELNAAHKSFLKEAQVLRNLHHPNVIKFMGIMFTKEKQFNLILEYIGGGTLKDIIHNISIALPWKLRVGYARDIAAAMQYLHSLNIIHRDLKSDNCLVRENGRTVVVADFGLSRINNSMSMSSSGIMNGSSNFSNGGKHLNSFLLTDLDDSTSLLKFPPATSLQAPTSNGSQNKSANSSATNSFIVAAKRKLKRRFNHQNRMRHQNRYAVVGNSFSMAPEMLKHQIYDERVDIFSFGIICCEIIGRVQADPDYLPRTSDFGLNVELFRKKYCEADCPKHFIRIAIACCELDPEKRPPFAKTHRWLDTILSHLEANNPIPKNLLKNILDSNNKNK